jgi:glycosyltransferase involved in cell wall biosynthesis
MRSFVEAVDANLPIDKMFVVYDAEAIYARRSRLRSGVDGHDMSAAEMDELVKKEVRLAAGADVIVSVSEIESQAFREFGAGTTILLGHGLDVDPTAASFEEREGFIFLGAIQTDDAPNADSLRWFAERVLPLVRLELGSAIRPIVVGVNNSRSVEALNGKAYQLVGMREDLRPWFERARVMIAPTRYAAGIPLKVYESAALGVPVVATDVVAEQAGWEVGHELLAASDPVTFADACIRLYRDKSLWESIRLRAIERCRRDCSKHQFRAGIKQILDAMPSRRKTLATA